MGLTYDGITYRSLEEQVRYDAEQVQLLKQADVTINENLQTINTEISGKLTKPANPSAESAVTLLADGTVGTKLLSEIGGRKLYMHRIPIHDDTYTYLTYLYIIASTSDSIVNDINNYTDRFINGEYLDNSTSKVYPIISFGARAGRDINFKYINADNVETAVERPFSEIKNDTATEL